MSEALLRPDAPAYKARDESAASVSTAPTWPRWLAGSWQEAVAIATLLTAWSLAERGFSGGRWSDVPIIKSFVDPRLYRQDPFIWTLHEGTPAAYPYQLIAAFVRALPALSFDQALFALYLPATIASLALLYRIGLLLSGSRAAAVLFLLLYVAGFRLVTLGSAVLHSAETTPQVLALPFQLASVYAMLVGRLTAAGLLMGVAFNLHAPTTVYMAAALALYQVLSIRRLRLPRVAPSLGLLGLAASPTIVGSLLQHGDQLPLWALNLAKAELATDTSVATHFSTRPLVLYNLLGVGIIGCSVRAAPRDSGRRMVLLFGLAVALMCLTAWLFFDLTLRTPLSTLVARLQLPRSAWILNVFGLLYLARYLAVGWSRSDPSQGDVATGLPRPLVMLLVAAMLAAPSDFVPLDPILIAAEIMLLACLASRHAVVRQPCWYAPWFMALLGGLAGLLHLELRELDFELSLRTAIVFAGLAAGWSLSTVTVGDWSRPRLTAFRSPTAALLRPGLPAGPSWVRSGAMALAFGALVAASVERVDDWRYVSAHKGGLRAAADFQEWARTETPVDSVFLLLPGEPNNNTFYENAERAVYLVRERANQAAYFRQHSFEFERRVRALGIEQPLRYREELDPAYRRLTEERVRALAAEFGVTHFVPARPANFTFPVVYQSGGWTVYEVR